MLRRFVLDCGNFDQHGQRLLQRRFPRGRLQAEALTEALAAHSGIERPACRRGIVDGGNWVDGAHAKRQAALTSEIEDSSREAVPARGALTGQVYHAPVLLEEAAPVVA